MILALKWIFLLPLVLLASFLIHVFVKISIGFMHGFDEMTAFWAADDMAGMPIVGTYAIGLTFISAYLAPIFFAAKLAPSHKQLVVMLVASVEFLILIVITAYLLWFTFMNEISLDFGVWYRALLEGVSALIGVVVGYGISKQEAETQNQSITTSE